MKVLEINDNKISKKKDKEEKKVDLKELYKIKEQENQAKLYGEQSSTQEEEKKTKSSTSSAADKWSEVKDIMNKNLQALNERGEKIEELQDKRFKLYF